MAVGMGGAIQEKAGALMEMKVLYHNHCFDGACSASLFTRFHRECIGGASAYRYGGLMHRAGAMFVPGDIGDGENAIVDFKYSTDPRVTWWFDHHQSAFLTAEDEAHFLAVQGEGARSGDPRAMRKFFDPLYTSCTGWIAHVAGTKFGFDPSGLEDLLYWADIVDGAKYESAKSAVEMEAPAMKLTMVIEGSQDETLIPKMIPLLTERTFEEVLDQDFVQAQVGPLWERHLAGIGLIGARAVVERGVISFDLMDQAMEGYSKFIPYSLHPEGTYVVGLSKGKVRTKISVGTNPWTTRPAAELANIAEICERYGGGGHARVGAVSFAADREDLAREAAGEIRAELERWG